MNREEWLENRRKGIGGSDIAAILGLNKWKTPLQVYLDKIGELPPVEENEPMKWGNVLEPVIIDEFNKLREKAGQETFTQVNNFSVSSPDNDRFICSPDAFSINTAEGVECKLSGVFGEELRNATAEDIKKIAPVYWYQCQWYLMVTGAKVWHLLILSHGREMFHFAIEPNQDDFGLMTEVAVQFLRMVDSRTPPLAYDGDEGVLPDPVEIDAEITPDLAAIFEEYESARQEESAAKKVKNSAKNQIIQALEGATHAKGHGWEFKYSKVERGEYTVAASSYNKTTIKRSKK